MGSTAVIGDNTVGVILSEVMGKISLQVVVGCLFVLYLKNCMLFEYRHIKTQDDHFFHCIKLKASQSCDLLEEEKQGLV